jgi:hypothetical protein
MCMRFDLALAPRCIHKNFEQREALLKIFMQSRSAFGAVNQIKLNKTCGLLPIACEYKAR